MITTDGLHPFLPETHLFHSRKKADKFIRRKMGMTPEFAEFVDGGAQTWCDNGIAVVLIECDKKWFIEAALLAHEAYHVVSRHYAYLGEENPSEEFVAYGVQVISGGLMLAHDKWRKRHGKEV